MSTDALFQSMARSVMDGEPDDAARLASQALELGVDPLEAISAGFLPGVREVGRGFECGELFLPDLVRAGEAMKAAVKILEPEMARRGTARETKGTVVLGTTQGDIHEIGKNLVGTMFSANGYRVYDLGVNVPPQAFVDKAREVNADIVGVSALLTTTMLGQRAVVDALAQAGLRPRVKVLLGGAPVTSQWVAEVGADGTAEDALGAVRLADSLLGR